MIERLNWDSDFFGYEIGKVVLSSSEEFNMDEFKESSTSYQLIYVFSKDKLNCKDFDLVDTKLTFLRETNAHNAYDIDNLNFFNIKRDDFKTLEALALSSGVYSRFKVDHNFKNQEYEKLYKKWIRNTVYEDKASDISIYNEDNRILGFTTLEKKSDVLCDIGLVAVDGRFRGRRIGTKLINFTIQQAFKRGFERIQVVTQLKNEPAINLYKKCGFKLEKTHYIYHYWNL